MMRGLAFLLVLSACATAVPGPEPPRTVIPARLLACPPGAAAPRPPASPRTPDHLAAWGIAAERARAQTEAARRECERRLQELGVLAGR